MASFEACRKTDPPDVERCRFMVFMQDCCMHGRCVCRTHVHPDVSVYGVCLHGIPFRPVVSVFIGRMLGVLYGM